MTRHSYYEHKCQTKIWHADYFPVVPKLHLSFTSVDVFPYKGVPGVFAHVRDSYLDFVTLVMLASTIAYECSGLRRGTGLTNPPYMAYHIPDVPQWLAEKPENTFDLTIISLVEGETRTTTFKLSSGEPKNA